MQVDSVVGAVRGGGTVQRYRSIVYIGSTEGSAHGGQTVLKTVAVG